MVNDDAVIEILEPFIKINEKMPATGKSYHADQIPVTLPPQWNYVTQQILKSKHASFDSTKEWLEGWLNRSKNDLPILSGKQIKLIINEFKREFGWLSDDEESEIQYLLLPFKLKFSTFPNPWPQITNRTAQRIAIESDSKHK